MHEWAPTPEPFEELALDNEDFQLDIVEDESTDPLVVLLTGALVMWSHNQDGGADVDDCVEAAEYIAPIIENYISRLSS